MDNPIGAMSLIHDQFSHIRNRHLRYAYRRKAKGLCKVRGCLFQHKATSGYCVYHTMRKRLWQMENIQMRPDKEKMAKLREEIRQIEATFRPALCAPRLLPKPSLDR